MRLRRDRGIKFHTGGPPSPGGPSSPGELFNPGYKTSQVLLKTHPEKLGGIWQFKIKTKFYFVMFKMTDGTVCLYADGNGTVKTENCTTGKGEETVSLCHAIFRRQEVLKSSVFTKELTTVKGRVDGQFQVKMTG